MKKTESYIPAAYTSHCGQDALLEILACDDSKISQLTHAIEHLERDASRKEIKIGVSGATTVDLLGMFLRKQCLLHGVKASVVFGNYDDPIGDIELFSQAGVDQVIILPFFDGLLPSFESQIESLESEIIEEKAAEVRAKYRLALEKANDISEVYLGTFHRFSKPTNRVEGDRISTVLLNFNTILREECAAFNNVSIIDTEEIVREVGMHAAFDNRFYFRNKAPYTRTYMSALAKSIASFSRGFGTYFYKVLALDCDNTLWGGVVGEDLIEGIELNKYDYPGNIYWRVQQELSGMERKGMLLTLVTKNNPEDIDEVLNQHPDMVIRNSQIIIKKANWQDKANNIMEIASELNLGLDSIIFLDDSQFECESMRQQLPMVKTIQVPTKLSEYPAVISDIKSLCVGSEKGSAKGQKTKQYRQRAAAEELRQKSTSYEDYLASLELNVELSRNAKNSIARISELSQKSNQFNLTTRRYTPVEVANMMDSEVYEVFSLKVGDRFGDAGLTGVVIVRLDGSIAHVENFFMSCRVLGRGIEGCIWRDIAQEVSQQGCTILTADFKKSQKNAQVASFYDSINMRLTKEGPEQRSYEIEISELIKPTISWIEVNYVR